MENITKKLKSLHLPIDFRRTNKNYIKKYIKKEGGTITNIIYSMPIYFKNIEEPIIINDNRILLNYYLNVIKNHKKNISEKCENETNDFSKCLFKNKRKITFIPISVNKKLIEKRCGHLNKCLLSRNF